MGDFLTLAFDESVQVYVYGSDHKLDAVVSNPSSVCRYDGWITFSHEYDGRRAETVIPADKFSRLMILYPTVTDAVTLDDDG